MRQRAAGVVAAQEASGQAGSEAVAVVLGAVVTAMAATAVTAMVGRVGCCHGHPQPKAPSF